MIKSIDFPESDRLVFKFQLCTQCLCDREHITRLSDPQFPQLQSGLMISTVLEDFVNNACKVLSTVPGTQQAHNKWWWTWLWGWRELFWSRVLLFPPEEVGRRQGRYWAKLGAGEEIDVLTEGLISEPLFYSWSLMSSHPAAQCLGAA